ncbi:hypothetical protein ACVII0_005999 [Sinorhizobium meliloti]
MTRNCAGITSSRSDTQTRPHRCDAGIRHRRRSSFRLNDLLDPQEVARKGAAIGCRGLECCPLEGARHHLQLPSYATWWTRPGDRWHAYLGRETPHGEPCAGKTARDQLSAIGSFSIIGSRGYRISATRTARPLDKPLRKAFLTTVPREIRILCYYPDCRLANASNLTCNCGSAANLDGLIVVQSGTSPPLISPGEVPPEARCCLKLWGRRCLLSSSRTPPSKGGCR